MAFLQDRYIKKDWEKFDYIIKMDEQNKRDIHPPLDKGNNKPVIAKLMDFVEDEDEKDIPDPYYTGNFDYTYSLVEKGCQNLLESIKREHNIS